MNGIEKLRELLAGVKAVIFDFDNIIVDSEPYHYEAYREVFEKYGHTIDREDYWVEWTSKGGGAAKEIRRFNLGIDTDEIVALKNPIYSSFCGSGDIRVFPEAFGIVKTLREAGYTLAIASGSYEHDIRAILAANGIEELFSTIVGKCGVSNFKPHPETYVKALKQLGLESSECIAIEDAEKGIRSALGAELRAICIETEVTRGFDIEGADLYVSGLAEFSRLLSEMFPPDGSDGGS